MKKIIVFLLIISFASCVKTNPKVQIQELNGYWEIEKVILADGSEKKYRFNQSIDFFEIKDSVGIRKKLQPQLDGSYISNRNAESFSLKIENDSLRIYYQTPMAAWKETIISLKETKMSIINKAGNVYFYKRYQKLGL